MPWQATGDGLRLAVRLTPNASRDAVEDLTADAQGRVLLGVKVAAPPVDGQANRALVKFLAKAAGIRQADVAIVRGEASRVKLLRLDGDPEALAARMQALLR